MERPCHVCRDEYPESHMDGDTCRFCKKKTRFAAFANECGLPAYLDPTGERYLYSLNGKCLGKKSERIDFMDELWNALVRAKGGDENLLIGERP